MLRERLANDKAQERTGERSGADYTRNRPILHQPCHAGASLSPDGRMKPLPSIRRIVFAELGAGIATRRLMRSTGKQRRRWRMSVSTRYSCGPPTAASTVPMVAVSSARTTCLFLQPTPRHENSTSLLRCRSLFDHEPGCTGRYLHMDRGRWPLDHAGRLGVWPRTDRRRHSCDQFRQYRYARYGCHRTELYPSKQQYAHR